jgi:ribosome recycling factor
MVDDIMSDVEDRMSKSVKKLQQDFAQIRTGRANPAMFDGIQVDVYGSSMPLNQVANYFMSGAQTCCYTAMGQKQSCRD